uniref:ATPase 8 n=1 Tax=Cipangopaludina japonica TaxID=57624 RepID=A0A679EJD8_9CAEN|nr:ATPase 8 [Cipangopaludina japonica]
MPQLSPLSWIFLFSFFWMMIFVTTILIWWINKTEYNFDISNMSCHGTENDWKW